jgi:secondary thiamine-phosphate synthase enzyme
MIIQDVLDIATGGRGTYDITDAVTAFTRRAPQGAGLCHVFVAHTSASLIICENADPQVLRDLDAYMNRLVPDGDRLFLHTAEGPDDMPAHVRSVLTQTNLTIPIRDRRLMLGTWQGIFLYEHRSRGHRRRVIVTLHLEEAAERR